MNNAAKKLITQNKFEIILCLVFISSRVIWSINGISFETSTSLFIPQLIDVSLLRESLIESVFYLHSQPPLFNLFVGLILKMPILTNELFFLSYKVIGILTFLFVFRILKKFEINEIVSVVLISIFMNSPNMIVFENRINYEYPVILLITILIFCLQKTFIDEKTNYLHIFFFTIASLIYIRTMFQIYYFVAIIFLLFVFSPKGITRSMILKFSIIPFILILALYGKNLILFDQFSTTSWMGLNLSRISLFILPADQRENLYESENLSDAAIVQSIYDYPIEEHQEIHSSIAVLQEVYKSNGEYNHHNINMIKISKSFLQDSLYVIKNHPSIYLAGIIQANYLYFLPPSIEFVHSSEFISDLFFQAIYNFYEKCFYKTIFVNLDFIKGHFLLFRLREFLQASSLHFLVYLFSSLYTIVLFQRILIKKINITPNQTIIIFMGCTIMYSWLIGTIMDLGENFRFRFNTDTYFLIFLALGIDFLIKNITKLSLKRK